MSTATIIDILRDYYTGSTDIDAGQARATQIDDAGSGVTYIGKAVAGSDTADAVWQIMKITDTGLDTAITWADGSGSFVNVWDDRASLTYS